MLKQKLSELLMQFAVVFLISIPLWFVSLLDSKPGTAWEVTEGFLMYVAALVLLVALLQRAPTAIPMKPAVWKALRMAAAVSFGETLVRWLPSTAGHPHETLAHLAFWWAQAFAGAFLAVLSLEWWRSHRKKRTSSDSQPNPA